MLRYIPHIVISLMLLASFSASGYIGWQHHQLQQAHASLNTQFDRLEKKSRRLQKNYSEQKSKNAWLMKTKRSLEAEKAELSSRVSDLKERVDTLQADSRATVKQLKQQLRAKVAECNSKLSSLGDKYSRAQSELEQATKNLKEKKETVAALRDTNQSLESDLTAARETIERYGIENVELVKTARELMEKYENKSIADVLAHKEPLTQLKKVELENMLQEYRKRIEAHSVESAEKDQT